jgi:hypothetical protein
LAPQNTPQRPHERTNGRSDRSPWNWLLIIPVVVPLLTFLYNSDGPQLAGFPFFYWLQLAFVLLSVAGTVVVHRLTSNNKKKEG